MRVENLDFEWWSRNTALILLGGFFLKAWKRGFSLGYCCCCCCCWVLGKNLCRGLWRVWKV